MSKTANMPYVLYMLRCNNGALYTGITNNLNKRLESHKNGLGSKYVRAHSPFELVYLEKLTDRSAASKREIEVKRLPKEQKEELCNEYSKSTAH